MLTFFTIWELAGYFVPNLVLVLKPDNSSLSLSLKQENNVWNNGYKIFCVSNKDVNGFSEQQESRNTKKKMLYDLKIFK